MKRAGDRLRTLFVCGILCSSFLSTNSMSPWVSRSRDLSTDSAKVQWTSRACSSTGGSWYGRRRLYRMHPTEQAGGNEQPLAAPELCGFIAVRENGRQVYAAIDRMEQSHDGDIHRIFSFRARSQQDRGKQMFDPGVRSQLEVVGVSECGNRKLPGSVRADESSRFGASRQL